VGGKGGEVTAKGKSALSGPRQKTVTSAMILGSLEYPQSTDTAAYTGSPEFVAFKFGANAGDRVDIWVRSADGGDAMAWILDDNFATLASNDDASHSTLDSHVKWTAKAGETFTHYLVIRDYWESPATFTVSFTGKKAKKADFYSCKVDSDCARVPKNCCTNLGNTAVNVNEKQAYHDSLNCSSSRICPMFMTPPDPSVAECGANHQCTLVKPADIACGGFTANAHQCPANYKCVQSSTPDVPGTCVETCGGMAGHQCSDSTDKCVYDDPNCDPANGGADCTGTCKPCTPKNCGINGHWSDTSCSCVVCGSDQHWDDKQAKCLDNACVQNKMCTTTSHWDSTACACVPDNCASNQHWDSTQGKCVDNTCVQTTMCTTTSHWDSTKCACVPNPSCIFDSDCSRTLYPNGCWPDPNATCDFWTDWTCAGLCRK
jgi:hypothetical protein